jgi:outer membrane protein
VSEVALGFQQSEASTNWNIGLLLSWPFFQGGLTHGQSVEAQGNLDAASAQMQTEELQIRFDVQQALLDVQSAKVVISAAREALVNAKEQLRLAEGRYESGVGSIIELGDAQVAEASAAAQNVQADFSLASARAELLSALGR